MRRVVLAHDADCWKTFDRKIDVVTPAGLIAVHVLSKHNGSDTRPWLICHLCDERPNAITEYAMVEQLAEQSVKAVRSMALDECDPPFQYMP